MNEKTYKLMGKSGCWNLIMGIVAIASGLVFGIMLIINGARLLKQKSKILI